MVRIRDTILRDTVELTTREPGKVSMYVCGPTVYDTPHIGNARTAVAFDTIRRYLEWAGLDVTFVSNVTDVEDKIIARAAREDRTEPEVASEFEAVYFDHMHRLNVRDADQRPHATEYIDRMLALIGELVDRGHAYEVPGQGVYFAVETFPGYGALPHRTIEELRESAGARVDVDDAKRSPMDFALWKAAKPGEPAWDSPWGEGRPGWHIECSAMSLDLLGEGFDLHGGGEDLAFPHHENERAQAEGAGHPFARHWIHTGMVTIGGDKMSKSLGNFTTVEDALDRPRLARAAAGHAPDPLPPRRRPRYDRAHRRGARDRTPRRAVPSSDACRHRCLVRGRSRGARPLPQCDGRRLRHRGTRWRWRSRPHATPIA